MDSSIVGKCCWVSGAISHNEWEPVGVPALVEAHFSLHSLLIWPGTDTEPILRDQIWQPLSLCSAVLFLLGWAWASLSFNNMYVHAIPSRSAHTALFCSHLLPRFVPSQKCKALCCVDPMRVGSAKNWYTAFLGETCTSYAHCNRSASILKLHPLDIIHSELFCFKSSTLFSSVSPYCPPPESCCVPDTSEVWCRNRICFGL